MDYKITSLNQQIKCEEQLIPIFGELKFGNISEQLMVFDSTAFYAERNIDQIDYRTFSRINKRYIEGFINNGSFSQSEVFFLNKDGHVLINKDLAFLFVAFAEPTSIVYFNSLIGEALTNGVAYSDGFIMAMAAQRIPSNVLQEIIDNRQDGAQGE